EMEANQLGTVRELPDANGQFSLTWPNPSLGVIRLDTRLGCTSDSFYLKEIVEKGIVAKNECRTKFAKMHVRFEAKPGELIYFVAPLSFWERHPNLIPIR